MSNYEAIAEFYDAFTADVDYPKIAHYIDSLIKKYGSTGNRVLDVACGTGSLTVLLGKMGYDMIGADESEDMLCAAREKAGYDSDILWLCQSARELDLYGDIDTAVCTLDSVNHITDFDDLVASFGRISLFLNRGGLFIFDVNTLYKHAKVLSDNSFVFEQDGVFCAWQNWYDEETHVTEMQLDFFLDDGDMYFRETQYITERAYTHEEILEALEKSNFEFLSCYDELTENAPHENSERVFYIARNVKK